VPENPEQLKALLGSFMDPESAGKAAEDIGRGLDLLRTHPAPAPSPERIASIKRDIQSRLVQGRPPHRILGWIGWTATAAAVLLGISLLTLAYWPKTLPLQQVTDVVNPAQWKIDIDPVLSGIEKELVSELDTILTINPDQINSDSPDPIETIQQELIMMASTDDFWKG
jgi:hypothetical protein